MKKYEVKWDRETKVQTFLIDGKVVTEEVFFETMRSEGK